MLIINMELNNMKNLDKLKKERTKYIKAFRNCTPLSNQTNNEFLEMRNEFGRKYKELDNQIIQIQRKNIRRANND